MQTTTGKATITLPRRQEFHYHIPSFHFTSNHEQLVTIRRYTPTSHVNQPSLMYCFAAMCTRPICQAWSPNVHRKWVFRGGTVEFLSDIFLWNIVCTSHFFATDGDCAVTQSKAGIYFGAKRILNGYGVWATCLSVMMHLLALRALLYIQQV